MSTHNHHRARQAKATAQVSVRLERALFAELVRRASMAAVSPTRLATQILVGALHKEDDPSDGPADTPLHAALARIEFQIAELAAQLVRPAPVTEAPVTPPVSALRLTSWPRSTGSVADYLAARAAARVVQNGPVGAGGDEGSGTPC